MPGSRGQLRVACNQWRDERLGQRQVGGFVRGDVASQLPDARQKRLVRVARDGEIDEILERLHPSFGAEHARRRLPAQHLRDFDIEQMRCVQCLALREKPLGETTSGRGTE